VEVFIERCAGLDIGKANLKACVRIPGVRAGTRHSEVRTFATTTAGLLALREWLSLEKVSLVGMESTGDYWKPVYYLLEDTVECWLLNAAHMKRVPGRKTDVTDSQWIAQLIEHGLVRPSFVPPEPIRQLRDLTRYRTALTQEKTREVQRLHGVLEDAGIKLSCVATDIMGRSGRAMLAALIAGERDGDVLAELAVDKLRKKLPALQEALVGNFAEHHARLVAMMLAHIDAVQADIDALTAQIDKQIQPFHTARRQLCTIPGVSDRIAEVIIAETGAHMARFPTPAHLTSWAGMCPGNNESAGRHKSGRTRNGDRWLRGALGQAAIGAARTKNTYLAARYRRLTSRRGKQRAQVAIGAKILEAAWHILSTDSDYTDLGADYYLSHARNPQSKINRLTHELQVLGYNVTLTAA
jgi:transposase